MSAGDSDDRPPGDARPPQQDAPAAEGPRPEGARSGRVKFDARGNAIWEWAVATGAFGREVSTERMTRLENGALSLAEDGSGAHDPLKPNPLGAAKGYDPYDSGKLGKARVTPKKTDLRKLGEWLKLKKQAADNKGDD